MANLKKQSLALASFISGVIGHHYIGKLLEYHNDIQSIKDQEFRDNNISLIKNSLTDLNQSVEKSNAILKKISDNNNIPEVAMNSLQEKMNKSEISCKEVVEMLDKQKGNINEDIYLNAYKLSKNCLKSVEEVNRELTKFLENYENNNFTFNLHGYTDYLNSLSIFEVSVLFHISILVVILLLLFNIFSVFFGNEIINYFKLEEKYPK